VEAAGTELGSAVWRQLASVAVKKAMLGEFEIGIFDDFTGMREFFIFVLELGHSGRSRVAELRFFFCCGCTFGFS
jgi:hypothetical protein